MSPSARLSFALALALLVRSPQSEPTATGLWTTISDSDHQPEAVVEILDAQSGYRGIIRQLLVPATHDDSLCLKCSDDRKGQPVIGMEIIRGMHRDGTSNQWSGGEILDPETGKTYHARMTLADSGRKLIVRGYVGISLFGRSQTWIRR